MEELKALLPEINEKVEDATEGLKTASTDAMKGSQVSRGVNVFVVSRLHFLGLIE